MVQNEEEIVEVSLEVHGPDAAKENGNRPTTATLSAWSGDGKVHPNPENLQKLTLVRYDL